MDTREKLRGSVEMQVIRYKLLWPCLGVVAAMVFVLVRHPQIPDAMFWAILIGPAVTVIVLAAIVTIIRMARIYRRLEDYFFCTTVLDTPQEVLWKGRGIYYSVTLEDPVYGYKYAVHTRAIFRRRGFTGLLAEKYTGKTVTIAYNRSTEVVVVIG